MRDRKKILSPDKIIVIFIFLTNTLRVLKISQIIISNYKKSY